MRLPLFPGTPAWSQADEAGLRLFLSQPLGQQFLSRLLFQRPIVSAKEGEARRVQQDERTGYETCIADILSLAEPTPITDEDLSAQSK